jgi:hypothetical protein
MLLFSFLVVCMFTITRSFFFVFAWILVLYLGCDFVCLGWNDYVVDSCFALFDQKSTLRLLLRGDLCPKLRAKMVGTSNCGFGTDDLDVATGFGVRLGF